MDIKWIEDFLSLAVTRNFSRSAEHRNVTQPAFSRRIRALEAWIGVELVDRSTYPLSLTPAGKLFNDTAAEAIRMLHDARDQLNSVHTAKNMLRVAAGHSLALSFFPEWLSRVKRQSAGEISARITATNVHDSVLSLTAGECDLLLCYHHPQLPILLDPEQYEFLVVGAERVLPVTAPGATGAPAFQLPGGKDKPVAALSYPNASFFGRVVELILANAPRTAYLKSDYESDMAELLKRMTQNGLGLAWMPERIVARELEDGKLLRAGTQEWSLDLEIRLFRSLLNKRPALTRLWDELAQPARS
ncbi:LysR substrate-binding domain-containing protein [Herbaspirillum lusitanum]|uniref:LysR substrate-binding domain-containing protein n=1 Tax=Herbaspirillum lusitanum TaxID=213312 RepID=A0ABW9A998_9BURK